MSITFEITALIVIAIALVGTWVNTKVQLGKLEQNVADHHRSSDEYRKRVAEKLDADTDKYGACRLNFTQQIQALSSKVDVSEAHYQEVKGLIVELKQSIDAVHRRLDEMMKKG